MFCSLYNIETVSIFYYSNSKSEKLALKLKEKLESIIQIINTNYQVNLNSGETYLLLLDRSFDPLTPILHDFYY